MDQQQKRRNPQKKRIIQRIKMPRFFNVRKSLERTRWSHWSYQMVKRRYPRSNWWIIWWCRWLLPNDLFRRQIKCLRPPLHPKPNERIRFPHQQRRPLCLRRWRRNSRMGHQCRWQLQRKLKIRKINRRNVIK